MLVYDFLFGQGIQCGGELKQCIIKHKSALQSCLAHLKVRAKVHRNEDLLPKQAQEAGANSPEGWCRLILNQFSVISKSLGEILIGSCKILT